MSHDNGLQACNRNTNPNNYMSNFSKNCLVRIWLADHSATGLSSIEITFRRRLSDRKLCYIVCQGLRACAEAVLGLRTSSSSTTVVMDSHTQVLEAADDKFGGVVIDSVSVPEDASVFLESLKYSLVQWRAQGKRGVWLKLPLALSHLVHPAIQEGFKYHHAEGTYVMLVTWVADVPSTIPANASHQVGIGAFVLNDRHEILAVQEKSGVFQGAGIWKMPTGERIYSLRQSERSRRKQLYDFQRTLLDGYLQLLVQSNVYTSSKFQGVDIDTEFVEVIAFRQAHKVAFEKSDIFFLCVLRPLTSEITIQDSELTAVKWMPLAEYRDQAYLKQRKLLKKMLDVCIATIEEPGYKGFQIKDVQAGALGRRPQYFYFNAADCLD